MFMVVRYACCSTFVRQCRFGVFQYVFIKVLLTLLTFLLEVRSLWGRMLLNIVRANKAGSRVGASG